MLALHARFWPNTIWETLKTTYIVSIHSIWSVSDFVEFMVWVCGFGESTLVWTLSLLHFVDLPWSVMVIFCGFGESTLVKVCKISWIYLGQSLLWFGGSTLVWPQKSSVIESTVSIPKIRVRFKEQYQYVQLAEWYVISPVRYGIFQK